MNLLSKQLEALLAELTKVRLLLERGWPERPADKGEKDQVEVEWVLQFLSISLSTFKRHVKDRLLSPVFKAGKREFYSRREVQDLGRRGRDGFRPFRDLL